MAVSEWFWTQIHCFQKRKTVNITENNRKHRFQPHLVAENVERWVGTCSALRKLKWPARLTLLHHLHHLHHLHTVDRTKNLSPDEHIEHWSWQKTGCWFGWFGSVWECLWDMELRTYEKKYCSVETCPVDCEWYVASSDSHQHEARSKGIQILSSALH